MPHLGALCVFMLGTAAPVGESCRMVWGDVDLSGGTAKLCLFKPTPWSRVAHLPPELVATMANLPTNRNPDELVLDYSGRSSLRGAWNNVCRRAGIERLTPHCRHGLATTMLHAGYDVKTVVERGGWKDAAAVLRTYAQAIKDRTVTNVHFDTPVTQVTDVKTSTTAEGRKKKA